jgi:hypothetical protein
MSDRTSTGGAKSFASHLNAHPKHLGAAEKRRLEAQRDRDEIAALRAHQAQLKSDMYERIGRRPPDPDRDRDFHDEFGNEAA